MSTIVRGSSDSRSGRGGLRGADGPGGGGDVDGLEAGVHRGSGGRVAGVGHGRRESRRPLTGRAPRVRNACLCRAAAQLGLAMPTDVELGELPPDATLGEAVDWWRARAPGADPVAIAARGAGVSLVLRTAVVVGVTLIGLAFSYGQAQ